MAVKARTFEEALARLEEITSRLEAGELDLEESLKLFEEGMGLLAFCVEKLNKAETQVLALTRDKDGKPVPLAFSVEEGADYSEAGEVSVRETARDKSCP